jgi:hypothetical protein
MAETTSGPINGKALGDQTGSDLPLPGSRKMGVGQTFRIKIISEPELVSEDRIEPWELYKYYSRAKGDFQADARIAEISSKITNALTSLRNAAREDDELQRENHVAIAVGKLYALSAVMGEYEHFDEALSAILTAIDAHKTSVYSRTELIALQKTLEVLRRSPNPHDEDLSLIHETLLAARFDLNSPLKGLQILEDEEL